jgi:hypothetical protein
MTDDCELKYWHKLQLCLNPYNYYYISTLLYTKMTNMNLEHYHCANSLSPSIEISVKDTSTSLVEIMLPLMDYFSPADMCMPRVTD